jgi:hypothetical protein
MDKIVTASDLDERMMEMFEACQDGFLSLPMGSMSFLDEYFCSEKSSRRSRSLQCRRTDRPQSFFVTSWSLGHSFRPWLFRTRKKLSWGGIRPTLFFATKMSAEQIELLFELLRQANLLLQPLLFVHFSRFMRR